MSNKTIGFVLILTAVVQLFVAGAWFILVRNPIMGTINVLIAIMSVMSAYPYFKSSK